MATFVAWSVWPLAITSQSGMHTHPNWDVQWWMHNVFNSRMLSNGFKCANRSDIKKMLQPRHATILQNGRGGGIVRWHSSIECLIDEHVIAMNVNKQVLQKEWSVSELKVLRLRTGSYLRQFWPHSVHKVDVHQVRFHQCSVQEATHARVSLQKFSQLSHAWISSWIWTGGVDKCWAHLVALWTLGTWTLRLDYGLVD